MTNSILTQFSLLKGFSEDELASLMQLLEKRTLQAGTGLFYEDDQSSEVYFILSGSIEIYKQGDSGTALLIATLINGQEIGELTLIDGEPRSASARVVDKTELFVLDAQCLQNQPELLHRLVSNIAIAATNKLRQSNIGHVQSLERELAAVHLQNQFGQFFVYTLSIFSIGTMVNYVLHNYLQSINIYSDAFTWSYLLVLLLPSLIIVRVMAIPLSAFGITWHNWKKSVREGAIASLGFKTSVSFT